MNSGRKQSERWRKMRLAGMNDDDILKSFDFPIPMRIFSWEGETDTVMTPNDSIRYYKSFIAGRNDVNRTINWICENMGRWY